VPERRVEKKFWYGCVFRHQLGIAIAIKSESVIGFAGIRIWVSLKFSFRCLADKLVSMEQPKLNKPDQQLLDKSRKPPTEESEAEKHRRLDDQMVDRALAGLNKLAKQTNHT